MGNKRGKEVGRNEKTGIVYSQCRPASERGGKFGLDDRLFEDFTLTEHFEEAFCHHG